MKLTQEQIKKVAHIPTEEVKADLRDAERELLGYETERRAIEQVGVNPTNKVRHYMLSAKCDKGHQFIDELNQILVSRGASVLDKSGQDQIPRQDGSSICNDGPEGGSHRLTK